MVVAKGVIARFSGSVHNLGRWRSWLVSRTALFRPFSLRGERALLADPRCQNDNVAAPLLPVQLSSSHPRGLLSANLVYRTARFICTKQCLPATAAEPPVQQQHQQQQDGNVTDSACHRKCLSFLQAWSIPEFPVVSGTQLGAFHGWPLLLRALTHASALPPRLCPRESGVLTDAQRWERYQLHNAALEFVGDRVLNLCVVDWLVRTQPWKTQGAETALYRGSNIKERLAFYVQQYVYNAHLTDVAYRIGLDRIVRRRLPAEKEHPGRGTELVLANAFEALVCAIFLEHGFLQAQKFVRQTLFEGPGSSLKQPMGDSWHADTRFAATDTARVRQEAAALDRMRQPVLRPPHNIPLSSHPKEALEKELLLWGLCIGGNRSAGGEDLRTRAQQQKRSGVCLSYCLEHEERRLSHHSLYMVRLELSGVVVARGRGRSIRSAENAAAAAFLKALGLDCASFRTAYASGEALSSREIWKQFRDLNVPLCIPDNYKPASPFDEDADWATILLWNRERFGSVSRQEQKTRAKAEEREERSPGDAVVWHQALGFDDWANARQVLPSLLALVLPNEGPEPEAARTALAAAELVELKYLGHCGLKLFAASSSLRIYGPGAWSTGALHDDYVRAIASTAVTGQAAELLRRLQRAGAWRTRQRLSAAAQRELLLAFLGIAQVLFGYEKGPDLLLRTLDEEKRASTPVSFDRPHL
jgi:dsRNA-specific ribonuclease